MRITRPLLISMAMSTAMLALGCSIIKPAPPGGTATLKDLGQLSYAGQKQKLLKINEVRMAALRDTALSIGTRSGLAHRSKEINLVLKEQERKLDRIFNFNGLIMEHNVMPPVLEEAKSTLVLGEPGTSALLHAQPAATELRISDRTYHIIQQATFVTAPPNWREYLWMNFDKPDVPDRTLLPRDDKEKTVWREYVAKGWDAGIAQANAIYNNNVEKLRRDYQGMVIYKKLLAANMVSKPFVAKTELGVTGDGNELRINDQVLRITAMPTLDVNSRNWKAVIAQ